MTGLRRPQPRRLPGGRWRSCRQGRRRALPKGRRPRRSGRRLQSLSCRPPGRDRRPGRLQPGGRGGLLAAPLRRRSNSVRPAISSATRGTLASAAALSRNARRVRRDNTSSTVQADFIARRVHRLRLEVRVAGRQPGAVAQRRPAGRPRWRGRRRWYRGGGQRPRASRWRRCRPSASGR